jgi:L(+)-tartrate dehydratase beta subunit
MSLPMGKLSSTVSSRRGRRSHAPNCKGLTPALRDVSYKAAVRKHFPASEETISQLRAGDEVTVDGHIIGIRDRTQIRIFDQGIAPPMDLNGAFLLHTAPGVRKLGPGKYEKICIGTTTSARMVRFTEGLGAEYGVRAICGKGGLPDEAIEPMQRLGMVYFAIVGGAAALETTQIEEIEEVAWEELMPECLWKFRVKDFGPLTVGIDSHGNSLFHDVQERAKAKLEELYERL